MGQGVSVRLCGHGPQEGILQWCIEDIMKSEALGRFLEQVSEAHPDRQVKAGIRGSPPNRPGPVIHLIEVVDGWQR